MFYGRLLEAFNRREELIYRALRECMPDRLSVSGNSYVCISILAPEAEKTFVQRKHRPKEKPVFVGISERHFPEKNLCSFSAALQNLREIATLFSFSQATLRANNDTSREGECKKELITRHFIPPFF